MDVSQSNLATFAAYLRDTAKVDIASIGSPDGKTVPVAVGRTSTKLIDLKPFFDAYLKVPERTKGTATTTTLTSFVDLVNRGKVGESVIFAKADKVSPQLIAVLNYNQPSDASAGWCDHRVVYSFPKAETWTDWMGHNGTKMSQLEFAEFIEDNLLDVVEAPSSSNPADASLIAIAEKLGGSFASPSTLLQLSRGLKVNVETKVGEVRNLNNGTAQIVFEETHTSETGAPLSVPSLFAIAIPVFDRDVAYRLVVRLRYNKEGGRLAWRYEIYQADVAFLNAIDTACNAAKASTSLPLFYGQP